MEKQLLDWKAAAFKSSEEENGILRAKYSIATLPTEPTSRQLQGDKFGGGGGGGEAA